MISEKQQPYFSTFAHGKLLLTGEYAVLDGAMALAVPTRFGQHLHVYAMPQSGLRWESYTDEGHCWFDAVFSLDDFSILEHSDEGTAHILQKMLHSIRLQNPTFLQQAEGLKVHTALDFPRNWGLGSSSTLVAALAAWAGVSPYPILEQSLGGSGYDLACAYASGPIRFQRKGVADPFVAPVPFQPAFLGQLYFVFLEKKQNSRAGIRTYRRSLVDVPALVQQISILTEAVLRAVDLDEFCHHLRVHERLISACIGMKTVQEQLFPDFKGLVKSLGAWGGDFVLVASDLDPIALRHYFSQKGYTTIFPYADMVEMSGPQKKPIQ